MISDACRAVNLKPSDEHDALEEMKNRGAVIVDSNEVPASFGEVFQFIKGKATVVVGNPFSNFTQ